MGIIFEDLRKDALINEARNQLESIYGTPLPEDIQGYLLDMSTASVIKVQQKQIWIDRMVFLCKKVRSKTAHESDYPLFLIHLYAIVVEFYEDESKVRDINLKISFKRPIMEALDILRAGLSEDDISLITFFRHSNCHMHPDYIWQRAKIKDGKIIAVKPSPDPEARVIADKIISQHRNQNEVAITYANKVIDKLIVLQEAVIKASAI